MSITDECINCGACITECDSNAIFEAGQEFSYEGKTYPPLSETISFIVPQLCTDCKTCVDACTMDAIVE